MYLVDLKQDKSNKNMYFSNTLLEKIEECLVTNKKIILYLNKRGDYASLICEKCSHVFMCKNCDTPMSIHNDTMVCHICNYEKNNPINCPECNSNRLLKIGVGTGQLEKFLENEFKNTRIFRFDTDMVKNKKDKKIALEQINDAQIIIGTKMITTGFDFSNIGLIGIILLEQELQIAKYNTSEKVYSNIKQLIGRGGRKGEKTDFLIQTFIPDNPLIKKIIFSNYKDFFTSTLEEREKFSYPPFSEYIILEYRDKDKTKAVEYMNNLKKNLENEDMEIISYPYTSRKNNQFYSKLVLKGHDLREKLNIIKKYFLKESKLSIIFD